MSSQLKVIDNFKYLGHLISSKSGDSSDIQHQMRLLLTALLGIIPDVTESQKFKMAASNVEIPIS